MVPPPIVHLRRGNTDDHTALQLAVTHFPNFRLEREDTQEESILSIFRLS